MTEQIIFRVQELKKYFPVRKGVLNRIASYGRALDGITFNINAGESFGCIGDSGAGKTVLIYCMALLYSPTAGNIHLVNKQNNGAGKKALRRFRRMVQVVYQNPIQSLPPNQTVRQILEAPLIIQKLGDRLQRREKIAAILEQVGLQESQLERLPIQLSGGQVQRVGIARAFILQPKLIFCDEPVSALDVSLQAQVLNLFEELSKQTTYFVASSNLSVLRRICRKCAVMYLGRFVEVADTATLCESPRHPYTRLLVDSIPDIRTDVHTNRIDIHLPIRDFPSIWEMPSGCTYHTLCDRAQEICRREYPPLTEMGENHYVYCHFPLQ